jgi:hypothetical protein
MFGARTAGPASAVDQPVRVSRRQRGRGAAGARGAGCSPVSCTLWSASLW